MNQASSSLASSSPMACRLGYEKRRRVCLTGLYPFSMFRLCSASLLGIPGISEGCQAKMSQFSRKNSRSAASIVGFSCAPGDSLATIVIDIPEVMTAPVVRKLRPVTNEEGKPQYFYAPFACMDFGDAKSGVFTPLAVLASGWFDPKINRLRACGNGNSVTKESPHYFVVGISVKNRQR